MQTWIAWKITQIKITWLPFKPNLLLLIFLKVFLAIATTIFKSTSNTIFKSTTDSTQGWLIFKREFSLMAKSLRNRDKSRKKMYTEKWNCISLFPPSWTQISTLLPHTHRYTWLVSRKNFWWMDTNPPNFALYLVAI